MKPKPKTLTREQILKAQDIKRETVNVPEWGGSVIVKTMTGRERDALEVMTMRDRLESGEDDAEANLENFRARMAVMTLVDDEGKQIFTPEDIEELGAKSAPALQRVYDVAVRLNKVSKADIDELVGNSNAGPSDASGSDSQAI